MMENFSSVHFHGTPKTKVSRAGIVKSLTPESGLIKDHELREKTVSAWALACQMGGYSRIEEIPSAGFAWPKIPLIQHVKQVTRITASILDTISEMGAKRNREHAILGALCHNIGVPLEMRRGQEGFHTPIIGAQRPGTFYGENSNMPDLELGVSYQVAAVPQCFTLK
jgi:hypothetical protein